MMGRIVHSYTATTVLSDRIQTVNVSPSFAKTSLALFLKWNGQPALQVSCTTVSNFPLSSSHSPCVQTPSFHRHGAPLPRDKWHWLTSSSCCQWSRRQHGYNDKLTVNKLTICILFTFSWTVKAAIRYSSNYKLTANITWLHKLS